MTFLSHTSCSSRFIQDFLDHYVDQCWYNDVLVGRSPCITESWPVNVRAHCQRRHDRLAPFQLPLHLIN